MSIDKHTIQGAERGTLLVGKLEDEGPRRLFFVNKVLSERTVEAHCLTETAFVSVRIRTDDINKPDEEGKTYTHVKFESVVDSGSALGLLRHVYAK